MDMSMPQQNLPTQGAPASHPVIIQGSHPQNSPLQHNSFPAFPQQPQVQRQTGNGIISELDNAGRSIGAAFSWITRQLSYAYRYASDPLFRKCQNIERQLNEASPLLTTALEDINPPIIDSYAALDTLTRQFSSLRDQYFETDSKLIRRQIVTKMLEIEDSIDAENKVISQLTPITKSIKDAKNWTKVQRGKLVAARVDLKKLKEIQTVGGMVRDMMAGLPSILDDENSASSHVDDGRIERLMQELESERPKRGSRNSSQTTQTPTPNLPPQIFPSDATLPLTLGDEFQENLEELRGNNQI